ncbi:MAG: ABC transporter ATP-binding protein [Candidatus Hatepunaea meridiana]|nr:ABC transporter ATP-binding protein [Candidatus Hatepunaea meridiana]
MKKLILNKVGKVFIGEDERQVDALHDVDMTADAGEFLCIIGPTGCGKTTLLRLIAGLMPYSSGSILLDEKPVEGLNPDCTLVFQQLSLFPWFSVLGNVAFALEMKGLEKNERRNKAIELLNLVGLDGVAKAKPYELSGGMQQRVAIARALAYDPEILLMDEPFGALDEKTRQRLQNVVLDLWREKQKTILFVTHNIDEAIYLADRILVMEADPGRIIGNIPLSLNRPRNRLSQKFIDLHIEIRNLLEISENSCAKETVL